MAAVIALVATSAAIGMFSWHNAKEAERESKEMALISQTGLFVGSFVKQATVKYDARERDQAIAMLLEALELAELVPAEHPLMRRQVYQAHQNLAEYYFETDRADDARRHCQVAKDLSDKLLSDEPNNTEWARLTGYSRRLIGRLSYVAGNWDDAQRHFEETLAIRKDLVEREPNVPHRKLELADAHTWVGRAARKAKRLDKAVRHDKAACKIFADMLGPEPEMAEYAIRLSNAEGLLSSDYMSYKTRDADKVALEILGRARQRLMKINGKPSFQKRIADNLVSIDGNIAIVDRRIKSSTFDQYP